LGRWRCGRVKYQARSDLISYMADKPRTIEEFFQLPGKFKRVAPVGQGRRERVITLVINGEHGWQYSPDGTAEMLPPAAVSAALRTEHPFCDLCNLARLNGPAFRLQVRGEDTIAGRPVIVLHAEAADTNPMDYAFDRCTALLVHSVRHLPQPSGPEKIVEMDLDNYRDVGGAPVPMHVVGRTDGQVLLEFTLLELEFADAFDDAVFAPA
jgi:hypothetical protein